MVLGTPDWYLDLILSFFLVIVGSVYYISVWLIFKLNTIIIIIFLFWLDSHISCCYVAMFVITVDVAMPLFRSRPHKTANGTRRSESCFIPMSLLSFSLKYRGWYFRSVGESRFCSRTKIRDGIFERFSLRSFIVYRRILVIIIPFVITIVVMVVIYDKGFLIPVIFISFKLFF